MQEDSSDCNPLGLLDDEGMLLRAPNKLISCPTDSWSVCLTCSEVVCIALGERFGHGYFEERPEEETLISACWQFRGFDTVDLYGLISGLKGCGYSASSLPQLQKHFRGELNEYGLFSNVTVASQFAEVRGLQISDHTPFIVVGILTR